jgi:hypothetical protein
MVKIGYGTKYVFCDIFIFSQSLKGWKHYILQGIGGHKLIENQRDTPQKNKLSPRGNFDI